ncbi:MAG: SGNH/GDSL hydrolase family protein [Anaerolineales bacterium]|nr:SGNH/GDSL hydrolase family protein [Anaerolineales bacterium]
MSKFFIVILIFTLLAGCSGSSNVPPSATFTAAATSVESGAATASPTQAGATSVGVETAAATTTPRPPLAPDEWKTLPAVPAGVSDAMREVYQRGLEMGNDPRRFSIIGDCQNVSSYFLAMFEKPGEFSLGDEYAYLQPTIDYYQGSYSRKSLAVKGGFNAAAVQSPLRADPKSCNKNESPLDCELRTWKPSVVFVSMETWWEGKPEAYNTYMRRVIRRILETGAVPIIATKADNLEGNHSINATIAQIAHDYDIPLWNFWAAVQPLPNHGLSSDGFHLTFARNFFDDPVRMKSAWPWRNLTALQTLDVVRRGLTGQP